VRGVRRASVAIVFLIAAVGIAGCGGGSSDPSQPQPGALRQAFLNGVVEELETEGASAGEIACVEARIGSTSERKLAERMVEGAPAEVVESSSEAKRLGPLGKGCF
jgi:hypothetical protein